MSILSLSDVGREIGAVTILENVSVSVAAGERIGLVGPNGAGKTTLLRMMIGRDEPDRGRVDRARGVNIEVLAQESSHDPRLLGAATLTDAVRSGAEEITRIANALQVAEAAGSVATPEYAAARQRFDALEGYTIDDRVASALRGLGFPTSRHGEPPSRLSGGEQTRVALARLVIADPDLLLLDEPTNHLDIDSRRALLDALNDYEGAVILITHDRSLMELVADRLWLAADGGIEPFDGDMADYAAFVLDRARQAGRSPTQVKAEPEPVAPAPAPPKAKVPTGSARRRAETAEAALAKANELLEAIDRSLTDPGTFASDPSKAAELGRRRNVAQAALEAAEQEWIAAQEAYETLRG